MTQDTGPEPQPEVSSPNSAMILAEEADVRDNLDPEIPRAFEALGFAAGLLRFAGYRMRRA